MSTQAYSTLSAPNSTHSYSRPPTRQSAPSIPEFVPRNPAMSQQHAQHRQCSHLSDSGRTVCGLDMLNERTPPLKEDRSESLSSTGSSSSLHTQAQSRNGGGYFGRGQGWIQPDIWAPPQAPALRGDKDNYHLLSMADDFEPDEDPMFNPSLAKLSLASPASSLSPKSPIAASSMTSDQISALVASFAPAPSQSPAIAQLVARSTRLAQGLAHPPPNRGFRPKANEVHDHDESNTTVFVGGLSQGVTESTLSEIFAPFGPIAYVRLSSPTVLLVRADSVQVKVPPGKGCGFVQFYSKHDSEHAIKQMQGFECMGCSLRTHWGRSQSELLTSPSRNKYASLTTHIGDRSSPSSAPAPPSEQVINQVVTVCAALGVPKEHSELVMRVLHACSSNEGGAPAFLN